MIRPTDVEPRSGHRSWLRFSDGAAGEIDLSDLAGRGVFEAWNDRAFLTRRILRRPEGLPGARTANYVRMLFICG